MAYDDTPLEVLEDPNYPGVKTVEEVTKQPTGAITGVKRVKPIEKDNPSWADRLLGNPTGAPRGENDPLNALKSNGGATGLWDEPRMGGSSGSWQPPFRAAAWDSKYPDGTPKDGTTPAPAAAPVAATPTPADDNPIQPAIDRYLKPVLTPIKDKAIGLFNDYQKDPQGAFDRLRNAVGGPRVTDTAPGAPAPVTGIPTTLGSDEWGPKSGEAASMDITGGDPNATGAAQVNKPVNSVAEVAAAFDKQDPTSAIEPPAGSLADHVNKASKEKEAPVAATPTSPSRPVFEEQKNAPGLFGIPGLLGKVGEYLHNMSDQRRMELYKIAGGLAAGGGGKGLGGLGYNFGKGLSAAADVLPEQQKLNSQNSTVNYLMNNGFSKDQAMAIMGNPQLAHETLGQLTGVSPPKSSNTDPGKPTWDWDWKSKKYVLRGMGSGDGGDMATSGPEWDAKPVEERLKTVAAQYGNNMAELVKAAGEGRFIPSARQKEVHEIAAGVYGAGYTPYTYKARQDAYDFFYGKGKGAQKLTSFNQAFAEHAAGLPENIEANNNWKFGGSALNRPANELGTAVGINNTFTALSTNSKALVDEVANLWKSTGATDKEIEGWQEAIGNTLKNGTPTQQKKAVLELVRLGEGALNSLEEQKQRSFGTAASGLPALVSPRARENIDRLKAWASDPNAKWNAAGRTAASPQATNQADIVFQGGHFYQHMPDGSFQPYKPPTTQ